MPARSRAAIAPALQIVSMGGGTGLSRLLSGLKHRVISPTSASPADSAWAISDLTAVVSVSDDGGSSGRLREEFRMLPPGDIRNCLVALAECEPLLAQIFQHRFSGSGQLSGHNFGNLFLVALAGITGDFAQAIHACSQVLAIRGKILPATLHDVRLEARCEDGTIIAGETNITRSPAKKESVRVVPERCEPLPETVQAIRSADIITLGPGSLLTSVLPNLLVRKAAHEIRKSRAIKIYIANIMTQPGETDGLTASDHIKMIYKHVGEGLFDAIIINNRGIGSKIRARYRAQGADPIVGDRTELGKLGLKVYARALASEEEVVRHDANKLARAIVEVYRDLRREAGSAR